MDSIEDSLEAKIDSSIKEHEVVTDQLKDRIKMGEEKTLVLDERTRALKVTADGTKVKLKVQVGPGRWSRKSRG